MIFVFWVALSVAVGVFASSRGRSGVGWFFLSLLISPVLGLLFLAVTRDLSSGATASAGPSEATHVRCPACAEWVFPEAAVCKHCSAALTPDPGFHERLAAQREAVRRADRKSLWISGGLIVLVALVISALTT